MVRKRKTKAVFPPSEVSWAAISWERETNPFIYRFVIYFLSGIFVVAGAFSSLTKIPITVTGHGKITSFDPPVPIRASSKMTVANLLVVENQHVKKGKVLLQSKEDMSKEDLAIMTSIIAELNQIMALDFKKCPTCIDRLRTASTHYLKMNAQGDLISVVTPLTEATKELILSLEEQRDLPLRVHDATTQINVDQKKLATIKSQGAMEILAKDVENLETEIAAYQTRINEKKDHTRERISAAKIEMQARISELKNRTQYIGQQYAVYAPFDGIVVNLNVKGAGELLQTGQELMSLIPEKSPLIVELNIENKDLSDISKSAAATITVDALPEYDYGYATGKVLDVTRKELDPNQTLLTRNPSGEGKGSADTPSFIVRISLDQQSLSKNGVPSPFIAGMTAKGQVSVRTESILHVVARTLFQAKDELQKNAGSK